MTSKVYFDKVRTDAEACALHFKGYDDHEIELREIDGQMHAVPLGWKQPMTFGTWKYNVDDMPAKYDEVKP